MEQRATAAERLIDIINLIQIGRKTGRLIIERGENSSYEEGTILFQQGQLMQASVGTLRGLDAYRQLCTWGPCHFRFTSDHDPNSLPTTPTPPKALSVPSHSMEMKNGFSEVGPLSSLLPMHIRDTQDALRYINHVGFSRTHLRLFLLIDGHRTVADLVRLIGLQSEAILPLLRDLEKAQLIIITKNG